MKRIAALLLLARVASADPGAGSGAGAGEIVQQKPDPGWFDKRVSAVSVGALYGVVGTWAYFAWFDGAHEQPFSFERRITTWTRMANPEQPRSHLRMLTGSRWELPLTIARDMTTSRIGGSVEESSS